MRLSTPYGTVTVLFRDALAGRIAGSRGACVLRRDEIRVAGDSISAFALAHEMHHVFKARSLGWRYLPWVLIQYAKSLNHDATPFEQEAEAWAALHVGEFSDVWAA